jgi:hypothetical protein
MSSTLVVSFLFVSVHHQQIHWTTRYSKSDFSRMSKELSVQEAVYPFSWFFRIGACEECVGRRAGQGVKWLSESLKRSYEAYQRNHEAESFLRA